jgi:hypothetical protein
MGFYFAELHLSIICPLWVGKYTRMNEKNRHCHVRLSQILHGILLAFLAKGLWGMETADT